MNRNAIALSFDLIRAKLKKEIEMTETANFEQMLATWRSLL